MTRGDRAKQDDLVPLTEDVYRGQGTMTHPEPGFPLHHRAMARLRSPRSAHRRRHACSESDMHCVRDADTKLALTGDQDLRDLGPDEFFGYGVDAGTGCFVDASASGLFGPFDGTDDDVPLDAFYGPKSGNPLVVTLTEPSGQATLVAFASGWGDGVYPTWVGRDDDGQLAAFVTDFHVVPRGTETESSSFPAGACTLGLWPRTVRGAAVVAQVNASGRLRLRTVRETVRSAPTAVRRPCG